MKTLYLQDSYLHERPHKVCIPYVITLFNVTLIGFEWSMTRLLLENIYKNDTFYNETGPCANYIRTIIGFINI